MASHLGTKYACFKCEAKFYDLNRPAPVCPKCGVDQRDEPPAARAQRKKARRLAELAAVEEADDDAAEAEADEPDDE